MLELQANLISTVTLKDQGCYYRNDEQVLFVNNPYKVIAEVYRHNGFLHLRLQSDVSAVAFTSSSKKVPSKASAVTWHARFGHISDTNLRKASGHVQGLVVTGTCNFPNCDACRQAQSKRRISRVPAIVLKDIYDEVSIDLVTIWDAGVGGER